MNKQILSQTVSMLFSPLVIETNIIILNISPILFKHERRILQSKHDKRTLKLFVFLCFDNFIFLVSIFYEVCITFMT